MSNTPLNDAETARPDAEAEELAAKHGIGLDEAKRHIEERGHDRAEQDGAAEAAKAEAAK